MRKPKSWQKREKDSNFGGTTSQDDDLKNGLA